MIVYVYRDMTSLPLEVGCTGKRRIISFFMLPYTLDFIIDKEKYIVDSLPNLLKY